MDPTGLIALLGLGWASLSIAGAGCWALVRSPGRGLRLQLEARWDVWEARTVAERRAAAIRADGRTWAAPRLIGPVRFRGQRMHPA